MIRLLAPKGSLEIHEEAWNAYPYCRTVITVSTFAICPKELLEITRGHEKKIHVISRRFLRAIFRVTKVVFKR